MSDDLNVRIENILSRLGKDEDVIEEVKQAIDFGALAREAIKNDPRVREAITIIVVSIIETIDQDIEDGDDEDTKDEIQEKLDFTSVIETDEVRRAIRRLVVKVVNNLEADDEKITEKVKDALNEVELLKDTEIREACHEKVKAFANDYIENIVSNSDEAQGILDEIDIDADLIHEVVNTDPDIQSALRAKCKELILQDIEGLDKEDSAFLPSKEIVLNTLPIRRTLEWLADHDSLVGERLAQKAETIVINILERLFGLEGMAQGDAFAQDECLKSAALKSIIEGAVNKALDGEKIKNFIKGAIEEKLREAQNLEDSHNSLFNWTDLTSSEGKE